jgi:biotin-(acetyl-CoA carboxylase) ligase
MARIRGKFLEVRSFGEIHRGVAEGLDRDGALILRRETEERIRIVAGDLKEPPKERYA